jgi:hypothetical protein
VSVRAGRDVADLTIALDNSATTSTTTGGSRALVTSAAGNLAVSAGRDLTGGQFDINAAALHTEMGGGLTAVNGTTNATVVIGGNKLPNAPALSFTTGVQQDVAFPGGKLTARIEGKYSSSFYYSIFNSADARSWVDQIEFFTDKTKPSLVRQSEGDEFTFEEWNAIVAFRLLILNTHNELGEPTIMSFTLASGSTNVLLNASPSSVVHSSGNIQCNWHSPLPGHLDWIAFYLVGSPNTSQLGYEYIPDGQVDGTFVLPTSGHAGYLRVPLPHRQQLQQRRRVESDHGDVARRHPMRMGPSPSTRGARVACRTLGANQSRASGFGGLKFVVAHVLDLLPVCHPRAHSLQPSSSVVPREVPEEVAVHERQHEEH